MSYILDALKKSEQERGHGKVPGVQTMHSSSLSYRSDKKSYWPYVLIVAVILNLLAILYFIIDKDKSSTMVADKKTQVIFATDEIKAPVPDKINQQKIESSRAINERNKIPQSAATATLAVDDEPLDHATDDMTATDNIAAAPRSTKANASTAAENIEVIEFYDLPESIKNQLPAIVISAHVFSTNPLQRSIVINNKFMEEGEYVIDDLMLIEITADGAIFAFQGSRFHYGVVSSWQ
jgi:general secretion pathway protein B